MVSLQNEHDGFDGLQVFFRFLSSMYYKKKMIDQFSPVCTDGCGLQERTYRPQPSVHTGEIGFSPVGIAEYDNLNLLSSM